MFGCRLNFSCKYLSGILILQLYFASFITYDNFLDCCLTFGHQYFIYERKSVHWNYLKILTIEYFTLKTEYLTSSMKHKNDNTVNS